ncbi:hypothetical protein EON65_30130 [archaeon]|nr:MAG: hypothetical protein EON65_30130 [archaeon]
MIALLEPDETANALFRRLTKASFHVKFGSAATEEFYFMENVEVIASRPEVPEVSNIQPY